MPLDPGIRRLLRTLSLGQARDPKDVGQRREAFRDLMRLSEIGTSVAGIEDRALPGPAGPVPIRLHTPRDADAGRLPALIFLHGGGYVCGDLDTHDALCRTLCEATGRRLIAVGYRLAPEHRFPAAVEDAHAAMLWVIDHAEELGLDAARIGIAGNSAGATHAAAVCQLAAVTRPGTLALQLVLCPILDWAGETVSPREFARGYLLDGEAIARELECCLAAGQAAAHPHVLPLRGDLHGQPPAWIHTAEFDPLREEGEAYAEKLGRAGVAANHTCHPGMVHMFYGLGRVVPYACEAHRRIGAEIRAALAEAASLRDAFGSGCSRSAVAGERRRRGGDVWCTLYSNSVLPVLNAPVTFVAYSMACAARKIDFEETCQTGRSLLIIN